MWRTFLATCICGVFNMWLLLSWVYIAPVVPYHCKISALDDAGFTEEQQLNLTNTHEEHVCEVPDLDYEVLGNLSYEEALAKAKEEREKVGVVPCEDYTFAETGTSCVEEFHLVCDRAVLLPTLQTVVPGGKLFGSLFMGWFSDGLGRKIGFIISSSFYMLAAAIPFVFQDYPGLATGRFLMGIGGTGCFYSGLTLNIYWSSILELVIIMIIRVTNSGVFAVIIVLTAELFPTEERATALGICSATSHVAGMLSSFLVGYESGPLGKNFGILLCGVATIAIAVIILLVPETKGKPLMDTIEDLEQKVKEGDRISCRNLVRFKWSSEEATE